MPQHLATLLLEVIDSNLSRNNVYTGPKKNYFNRIASIWNLLPKSAIEAKSVNEFKNIIDDLNIV